MLLDAAVQCLFDHGYAATTTMLVAKTAGVSRGAMLHQFPTKHDLMAYVVEAVSADELDLYADLLKGTDEPAERLIAYPEAAWKVLSQPSAVAVQEILQGARGDAVLVERLKAIQARVEAAAGERLKSEFPGGIASDLFRLIVSAARGLAISQVLNGGVDVSGAVRMLQTLIRAGIDAEAFSGSAKLKMAGAAPQPTHPG
ncbi:TetR/AcrR family transcriptional regulator [Brevundimonas intermedia]|uniref:TetR/AcrR family transcriptional regulator n=1 Tax=Brevundimonas intermedia TaxID=74315 RepID=UPI00320B97D3